jgi:hypothetical protein
MSHDAMSLGTFNNNSAASLEHFPKSSSERGFLRIN